MDVRTYTFTGANSAFTSGGIFFTLLETTSEVDLVFYRQGSPVYKANSVKGGFSVDFTNYAAQTPEQLKQYAFDRVEIIASGANTVKAGVSRDGRGGFNEFSGNVQISGGGSLANTADVSVSTTATLIKAADSTRKEIIISNVGGTDTRIGASNVTATNGHLLAAGGVLVLTTTAAVYGIVAAGTNAVSCLEIKA